MSKTDLQLLQDHEPILRFSGSEHEERFYPIRISDYLSRSSLHRRGDSVGLLGWLRGDQVIEGWDEAEDREQALGNFTGEQSCDFYLSFKPEKPADDKSTVRLWIGISGLIMLLATFACGWWGYTLGQAGNLWSSRVVSFLAIFGFMVAVVLVLQAFGISEERLSRGGDKIFAMLIGSLFLVLLPLVFGRWFCSGILLLLFALLLLSEGEQLAVFALALISPIGEEEAALTRDTCQNWKPVYYGRVKREGKETILQYFFFYALNDWRHHDGFNNHQGDWEGVFVFLEEVKGKADSMPKFVGFSQHHLGEVFPWDAVHKETFNGQEHPVIYVATGSHANYHEQGETFLEDLVSSDKDSLGYKIARFIRKHKENMGKNEVRAAEARGAVRKRMYREDTDLTRVAESELIIAMEHHKGDGRIIGPSGYETGQPVVPWPKPVVLDDENLPVWTEFRGLWGLKTLHKDESGPPSPKWKRRGDVKGTGDEYRLYWADPLGWRREVLAWRDRRSAG